MSKGWAYYNDTDPFACEWVRQLMKQNLIAPGVVDERSIADVSPEDIREFTQVHMFCGIAVWSYSLRRAGWDDGQPVWTGSCPCQPYSVAGQQKGHADDRHLWPQWWRLIRECRPAVVFGEQVSGAIRHGWLDLVQGDLEAEGYAVGAAVLGAHSVGAPHIRQRLYFVAHHAQHGRREECAVAGGDAAGDRTQGRGAGLVPSGAIGLGADAANDGQRDAGQRKVSEPDADGEAGRSDHSLLPRLEGHFGDVRDWRGPGWLDPLTARSVAEAGATRGFWTDCDWWYGRDGKYRPIESGLFPLAHGATSRVGRLRGYGNAIVAPAAIAFIEAAREAMSDD